MSILLLFSLFAHAKAQKSDFISIKRVTPLKNNTIKILYKKDIPLVTFDSNNARSISIIQSNSFDFYVSKFLSKNKEKEQKKCRHYYEITYSRFGNKRSLKNCFSLESDDFNRLYRQLIEVLVRK